MGLQVSFRALYSGVSVLGVVLAVVFCVVSMTMVFFEEIDGFRDVRAAIEDSHHEAGKRASIELANEITTAGVDGLAARLMRVYESEVLLHTKTRTLLAGDAAGSMIGPTLDFAFDKTASAGQLDYLTYLQYHDEPAGPNGTAQRILDRGWAYYVENVQTEVIPGAASESSLADAFASHDIDAHEESVRVACTKPDGAAAATPCTWHREGVALPNMAPLDNAHITAAIAGGHAAGWMPFLEQPLLLHASDMSRPTQPAEMSLEDYERPPLWVKGLVDVQPTTPMSGGPPGVIPSAPGAGSVFCTGTRLSSFGFRSAYDTERAFVVVSEKVLGGEWRIVTPPSTGDRLFHTGAHPVTGELNNTERVRQTATVQESRDWLVRASVAAILARAEAYNKAQAAGGFGGVKLTEDDDPFVTFFRATDGTGQATLPFTNGTERMGDFLVSVQGLARTFWVIGVVGLDEVMAEQRAEWTFIEALVREIDTDLENESVQRRILLVVPCVILTVVCAIVSVYVMTLVHRDTRRFAENMEDLKDMKLSPTIMQQQESVFTEIAGMEASYMKMYASLREFREYIPDAVLQRAARESDSPASSDEGSQTDSTESDGIQLHRDNSGNKDGMGASTSIRIGQNGAESPKTNSAAGGPLGRSIDLGAHKATFYLVRKKAVTQVAVACRDFDEWLQSSPCPSVATVFLSHWLAAVTADVTQHAGVVEQFHGDVVDVSFGGLETCHNAPHMAMNYVMQLRDRLHHGSITLAIEKAAGDHVFSATDHEHLEPLIGVAMSPALAGRVGCEGFKQAAVLGRAAHAAHSVMGCARDLSLDVCLNQRIAEFVEHDFRMLPVDMIKFNHHAKKQIVYYVEGRNIARGNSDWMYGSLTRHSHARYRAAWQVFMELDAAATSGVQTKATFASVIDLFNLAGTQDPLARLVCANLQCYVDEVQALSGKPPQEYAKLFHMSFTKPNLTAAKKLHGCRQRYMSFSSKSERSFIPSARDDILDPHAPSRLSLTESTRGTAEVQGQSPATAGAATPLEEKISQAAVASATSRDALSSGKGGGGSGEVYVTI